jgi:anti-sigma B factor antagonist
VCHSKSVELEVLVSEHAGISVVTVIGELDAHAAPLLRSSLDPLWLEPAVALVVDLSGVGFIDSTGLGVLVTALKHVREAGGTLDVVASSPRVLKVFALTGMDVVIPMHATLAEALPPA